MPLRLPVLPEEELDPAEREDQEFELDALLSDRDSSCRSPTLSRRSLSLELLLDPADRPRSSR
jgi:hypothetical protein